MAEGESGIPEIAREKYKELEIPGVDGMTISFEIPGYALLHYTPSVIEGETMSTSITRRAKIWNDGLLGAAILLASRKDVQRVGVVSWIVKKNPKILARESFVPIASQDEFYKLGKKYIERIDDGLIPQEFAEAAFDAYACNKKDFVDFQFTKNGVLRES